MKKFLLDLRAKLHELKFLKALSISIYNMIDKNELILFTNRA